MSFPRVKCVLFWNISVYGQLTNLGIGAFPSHFRLSLKIMWMGSQVVFTIFEELINPFLNVRYGSDYRAGG